MKDVRYANRGASFEEYIKFANDRYKREGVAVVIKIPTEILPIRNNRGKVVNAKVCSKSTVDFMGRYRNIPVAIEAKHTYKDRISFSEVKDHQAKFLDDFTGMYGIAFGAVLVSFKLERFFLVPWEYWRMARKAWEEKDVYGKKTYTITHNGFTWTTPGKASVSADELLPEWEIKQNNKYGLAYLSKIDTYTDMELTRI